MEESYIDRINRLENECRMWEARAREEYIKNGCVHNKQECIYLQTAVSIRNEMASISTGTEKMYQKSKISELNTKIRESISGFDPEYFERLKKKEEALEKSSKKNNGNSAKATSSTNSDSEKSDKKWFKPIPEHSFEKVSGMESVKESFRSCLEDAKYTKIKDYLHLRKNKSIFLYGPPGCGKTYLIEAFVNELYKSNNDYKFIPVKSADILSKYVGDAENTISEIFQTALEYAPTVIFFDEIDGVCKDRSSQNLPEYASSITTSFLIEYNKTLKSDKPIMFIGATNYPAQIDRAMLDRVDLIEISYPDKEARINKFRMEFTYKDETTGENTVFIKPTNGFSFAEMGEETEGGTFYNYRDMERLCDRLKDEVMKTSLIKYGSEEEAIVALQSGEYGIDKDMFIRIRDSVNTSPKDESITAIEAFKKSMASL